MGRIAARKGVEAAWAQDSSDQLGGMADHMVLVALEVAAELQAALFCPDALTASLGEQSRQFKQQFDLGAEWRSGAFLGIDIAWLAWL